jgi:hypothetical protein
MKSKEVFYAKKRVKENKEWVLKDTSVDIYEIVDTEGNSLGATLNRLDAEIVKLKEFIASYVDINDTWKIKTNEVINRITKEITEE